MEGFALSAKFSRQVIGLTTAMAKETAGCRSHELDCSLGPGTKNRAMDLDLMNGGGGGANDNRLRSRRKNVDGSLKASR